MKSYSTGWLGGERASPTIAVRPAGSFRRLAAIGYAMATALVPAVAEQLVFSQPGTTVELAADEQTATVVFPFANRSARPVVIREIRTECDCVRASVSPSAIDAGQSGAVSLRFHARIRNGTEVIRAEVVADDGVRYPLSVSAKLHSYIEVTPRMLQWPRNEPRKARELVVRSTGLGKLRFTQAATIGGAGADLLKGADAGSVRVLVSPPQGDKPFQGRVVVAAVLDETNETRLYEIPMRGE